MTTTRWVRLRAVAAIVLVATLTLPAYTCDGYRAPGGDLVGDIPAGADSSAYVATQIPHRPLAQFEPTTPQLWLSLLAYTWPLMLLGIGAARPAVRRRWPYVSAELVLPPAGAWFISAIVITGDIAYGSVIALTATAVLFLLSIAEIAERSKDSS